MDALNQAIRSIYSKRQSKWIMKQITAGLIRWPEDKNRLSEAITYHLRYKDTTKYRQKMSELYQDTHPKHLTLHDLENIQAALTTTPDPEAAINLAETSWAYDDGVYKILQIGGTGTDIDVAATSAAKLAKGTRWCTRNADDAKEYYLISGPLFIIFKNNQKIAQFDHSGQIKDIYDKDIVDKNWFDIILQSGIAAKVPFIFVKYAIERQKRYPEIESIISDIPYLAYKYAKYVICGRWPEAEAAIRRCPEWACLYASHVIGGRWPEAESVIARDAVSRQYYSDMISPYNGYDELPRFW